MATRTISPTAASWSNNGSWVEGIPPTAEDDVVATALSGSLTINVAAACRSIDLSAYTATLTHNAVNLVVGDASGGALNFSGSWTYTRVNTSTSAIRFDAQSDNGGAGWPITWGGKTFGSLTFQTTATAGKWVFQDALPAMGTGSTFSMLGGHLDTNNHNLACSNFASTGTSARTLTLGTSTVTITGTGTAWNVTASAIVSAASSTIVFTNTGATSRTFAGGGHTYGTVSFTNASTATFAITGANFINTFNFSGAARTLSLGTQVHTFTNWNVNGASGALISIVASTPGTNGCVVDKAGGGVAVSEYVALTDITATPASTWYASTGSVDNGNNDGWIFGAPPAGGGGSVKTSTGATKPTKIFPGGVVKPVKLKTGGGVWELI